MITNNNIHLMVTGPRASKLFGRSYKDTVYSSPKVKLLINVMVKFLELNRRITKVYIGMNSGIDLLFGVAVHKFKQKHGQDSIELICCIPGTGQMRGFTKEEIGQYYLVLKQTADKIEQFSIKELNPDLYQKRTEFMIENSHMTLAFWNLVRQSSNTYDTMCRTRKADKPVYLFDSQNIRENGIWWNPPISSDKRIVIRQVWKEKEPVPEEIRLATDTVDMWG